MSNRISVYFDGASRGNPGQAGAGAVVKDKDGEILGKVSSYLGKKTNNQAEYLAVMLALDFINDNPDIKSNDIILIGDSQLVIKQLIGEYKIKNEGLKDLYWQIREKVLTLGLNIDYKHIPREKNQLADEMANKAIDKNGKE